MTCARSAESLDPMSVSRHTPHLITHTHHIHPHRCVSGVSIRMCVRGVSLLTGLQVLSRGTGTGEGGNCCRNKLWIFGIVADEVFVVLFHFLVKKLHRHTLKTIFNF